MARYELRRPRGGAVARSVARLEAAPAQLGAGGGGHGVTGWWRRARVVAGGSGATWGRWLRRDLGPVAAAAVSRAGGGGRSLWRDFWAGSDFWEPDRVEVRNFLFFFWPRVVAGVVVPRISLFPLGKDDT